MKRSLLPLFGVAFVAALAATGIFYSLLGPHGGGISGASANAMVVVAARPIALGAVVRPEDLKSEPWRDGALPQGALRLAGEAAGRVALRPIGAGEILTANVLAPAAAGATAAIPPGMRAVSLHPVDSHGVVALLRSGSRVDVQVVSTRGEPSARRLLEDIEVLSVDRAEAQRPVVTVLATPEQSDRLALADALGQIRLLARNPAERAAR
ncbi:MAG: Flp pilus assembly protein CpaB [Bryobacteraceae bacterium]|nr:Flp pilus assembly protein CpaB [Bryobacteraceae bacterium]MCX7603920.1 Flp pilus assembly protein CpaB [Bryobacteraceae bacterium]